jgi:two-component system, LytTR family, sensor kinase
MTPAENIFVLSVHMVLGVSAVLFILMAYLWFTTKDTTLGLYALTLAGCLIMAIAKKTSIAAALPGENIMENSWLDEFANIFYGAAYLFFFSWVFNFQQKSSWARFLFWSFIAVMIFQLLYLVYAKLYHNGQYYNSLVWLTIFFAIGLLGILILITAFTVKRKTSFQKVILAGVLVFFILVMLGNLQEYLYKSGNTSGFNIIFFALLIENIFFMLAAAQRIKEAYQQSASQKMKEYQYQLEIEQVVNYFATAISVHNSADEMLWSVSENLIGKLGFEDCVIYLVDDDKKVLLQKAAWGPKTTAQNKIINPIRIAFGQGIVGTVAVSNRSEIIPDTSKDRRYIVDDAVRYSEIAVPISIEGKVLGVIDSEHSQKAFYTEKHLQILTTIASLLAIRLVKLKAEETAKAKEIEMLKLEAANFQYQLEVEKVINYFATSISVQYTIDDMLWDVSKNLIGKLGFEECMIYLWNEDKTVLIQRAGYGLKGDMQIGENKSMYHIPKGKGVVGAAADCSEYILVNDTSRDPRYFSADEKIMFSELCVPVIYNNDVIGVINTEHSKKNFFTQRHVTILTTIASLCAEKIDKINAGRQAREKEIELLVLNKDLATSQLTALRSQMNPHFLFNAMNSIQQFILKGDIENANRYISKFSVLLRKVLYSSQQDFITIDEETELLGLYLDIEQLRMGDDFSYTITVDEEIEADACKIPGMLLQPFVENALKHGLALKEGEKKLAVNFSFYDEQWIMVQVSDNGIGRTAAETVKQQQNKMLPHESKGIQLIKERLQLLGASREVITIEDQLNTDGKACGTLVKVLLPLQFSVQ